MECGTVGGEVRNLYITFWKNWKQKSLDGGDLRRYSVKKKRSFYLSI